MGKEIDFFIGDVFTIPPPPQARYNPHREAHKIEEAREKYLKNISKILEAQIVAFNAKSCDRKLVPHNCYVSCESESMDVAIAMSYTSYAGYHIVTHWELQPVNLESGQAVFSYGW